MWALENQPVIMGSYVGVVNTDNCYPKYTKFIIDHTPENKKLDYLGRFAYGHLPHLTNDITEAYAIIDGHWDGETFLYLIEDMNNGAIYIVEKSTIKKYVRKE